MLSSRSVAAVLMACVLHGAGTAAVSLRRTVSGLDTFDKPGFTPIGQPVSNDRDGTLQYDPKIAFFTPGGTTKDLADCMSSPQIFVGIKPQSSPNLVATKVNETLSSLDKCTRIKSFYFGCTQPGAVPNANLPLSCTVTLEALGSNDEVLDFQAFAFTPHLNAEGNPMRITSRMEKASVLLGAARKFRISATSSDTRGLTGLLALIAGLGIPPLELPGLMQKLRELFIGLSDNIIDYSLDDIAYETGVYCPA